MVNITEDTRNTVCSVSVMMIVFKPPLNVYDQIRPREIKTVAQNGIPYESKMNRCNTITTKYSLNEDPMVRLKRKILAAVL
jgi:hypothetical protein